jgi:WS/DGAT/MGAT family acyltransferase
MDQPTNPMVITSMLVFDGPVEHGALRTLLREKLLRHARFSQRVDRPSLPFFPAHWEPDPAFDLDAHLVRVRLPADAGEDELRDLVSERMSAPLARDRPLWEIVHVESPRLGSSLVARVHHAVGDGVALVKLLLSLTDEGADLRPEVVGLAPVPLPRGLALARKLADQGRTLARLLLLPSDPPSGLRAPLGAAKECAWSRPLSLDALKSVAKKHGAKLNDLLLAQLAGALHEHLSEHGHVPDELRALVPVYLRGRAGDPELGNHFGLVFVPLPIGDAAVVDRLTRIKRTMDEIKGAEDALVALGVLGAMGLASEGIERIGVDIFTRKASLLVTNVPGPPAHLHLAGRRLDSVMVWAPMSGSIGTGVSLLTYAGQLRVGVTCDARLVARPSAVVAGFERQVQAMIASD